MIILVSFGKAHYRQSTHHTRKEVYAFFFFFDNVISELEELAKKLQDISAKIPNKAEIKELVVRTAKGE